MSASNNKTPGHSRQVRSVCPYCGVGCGIVIDIADGRAVKVSGDKSHPANRGRLCTKGGSCTEVLAHPDRLRQARVRSARDGSPEVVDMEAAIRLTAQRLCDIRDQHGPDALSFYVSGQMSLEAQYLINKLAKGFVGTNHLESNSRLCMASAGSGYKLSLGADAPPGSYDDFDKADLFLVIGSNMADCHPILFLRMMDRVKAGAKLVVIDPRRTATADKADLFLQIRPGTDLALLNGLLYRLWQLDAIDHDFIARYTDGWEIMPDFLADYPLAEVATVTGLPEAEIEQLAQWLAAAPEWISCWTMGLNQSTQGTWHTNAICNLHLATGKICRPGSGPFSLTGQPNAMGGREMGYMGLGLPGQRSLANADDRVFVEQLWQLPAGSLRLTPERGTVAMFEAMRAGEIKACWIICTNPVATVPNRQKVIEALQCAELVIAQDVFAETETNRYADILLPAALWAEAEGVMINSERNLTLMQQAVPPPGEAMADWQIIARVACAMGYADAFSYASAAEVFAEIRRAWNPQTGYDLRGISYEQLRETSMQWPCAPGGSARNPQRYHNDGESQVLRILPDSSQPKLSFPTASGRAQFWPRPCLSPAEMPDEDFAFVLNTGRQQHQWHTASKTGKIATLNKLNPGPFVEIHPQDAARLGIAARDQVEIASRRGSAVLPAVIADRVLPGNCFVPFHWNDVFGERLAINAATSDAVDAISLQPELKCAAVMLRRVAAAAVETPVLAQSDAEAQRSASTSLASAIEDFAVIVGVNAMSAPPFNAAQQAYLHGLVEGLRRSTDALAGHIPVLPAEAPFDAAARAYVEGLLAGLFSRVPVPGLPDGDLQDEVQPLVTVIWASQTGNAESAAEQCVRKLKAQGYRAQLRCADSCSANDLMQWQDVLLVTSTFGDGDAPDCAGAFWQSLQQDDLALAHLSFAVLALGDSSYDNFCGFGRALDTRLQQLGAQRLTERSDCEPDYAATQQQWLQRVLEALAQRHGQAQPQASEQDEADVAEARYSRQQPLHARLIGNHLLNGEGAGKETRQIVFDIADSGLQYEAGDALGVWPENDPQQVCALLACLDLSPQVEVHCAGQLLSLQQALQQHCDIAKVSRDMLENLQDYCDAGGRAALQARLAQEAEDLKTWLWGRQVLDVLREYPARLSAEALVRWLKPLQPRLYSISSSPQAHAGEVHLTMSTVRYHFAGETRGGVCSTFLADRAVDSGARIFVQKSAHFRLPAQSATNVIMIGPGTGVAPFRAFLHERQARGDSGSNWLFFGEQRAATDFYYRDELEQLQRAGVLTRLDCAFSRDQQQKIYVQDRMREQGAELWSWLQQGAHVYVCGDAARMAKDVDAALKAIVQLHGGFNEDDAAAYVAAMSKDKRYRRDVY